MTLLNSTCRTIVKPMRILLEDDANQLEPLHSACAQAGHIVNALRVGAIAQLDLTRRDDDGSLLKRLLPQASELPLCQPYRHLGTPFPVLMLAAKDATSDEIRSLDARTDDSLLKPCLSLNQWYGLRALARTMYFLHCRHPWLLSQQC